VNGAIALAELPERFDVDAVLFIQATAHLEDADDLVSASAMSGQRSIRRCRSPAQLPGSVAIQAQFLIAWSQTMSTPASGSLTPPARPTDVNRFASDDRGARLPRVHGVGVHDPSHGLFVGVHVGAGTSFSGPMKSKSSAV